jgi:phenylacetate-CoA ligase
MDGQSAMTVPIGPELSRAELTARQDERLAETVERAHENVPFYRELLDGHEISPADIDGIDDIERLPMTTKDAFREEYPDGLFAVADEDITRIHASSGTTGTPKVVGYTDEDLERWAAVVARSLAAAGIEPGDTVQNAYGYGLFTGGLGLHDGIERLGATVVPMGGGNTARQLTMAQDMASDALACTPSYCLYLADYAEEQGLDPRELPFRTVVIGAEPFTDPMREEIETALDVTAIDIYGLSEIIGPGVAVECAATQDGLHVWEDHFYPEIIDPETEEVLPAGETGELVLTTLTKEAQPILRYRTGDIIHLHEDDCDCGRTAVRMGNVTGRTDDLLIVRGVNVYASQIEAVMVGIDDVAPHYRIDLHREDSLDAMDITVEPHERSATAPETLRAAIGERLDDQLNVSPDSIDVVDPGTIERTEVGKVKRVFDHR